VLVVSGMCLASEKRIRLMAGALIKSWVYNNSARMRAWLLKSARFRFFSVKARDRALSTGASEGLALGSNKGPNSKSAGRTPAKGLETRNRSCPARDRDGWTTAAFAAGALSVVAVDEPGDCGLAAGTASGVAVCAGIMVRGGWTFSSCPAGLPVPGKDGVLLPQAARGRIRSRIRTAGRALRIGATQYRL